MVLNWFLCHERKIWLPRIYEPKTGEENIKDKKSNIGYIAIAPLGSRDNTEGVQDNNQNRRYKKKNLLQKLKVSSLFCLFFSDTE